MKKLFPFGIFIAIISVCGFFIASSYFATTKNTHTSIVNPHIWEESIRQILPSDSTIFTQGIYKKWEDFILSSGAPMQFPVTQSQVGILQKNGNFTQKIAVDKNIYFGEGITELDGKLYWTFWKNKKIYIYSAETYEKTGEWDTPENMEWWWLANDGKNIILSDGSEFLTFYNPENGSVIKKIRVTENGNNINNLNELEYIDGKIFANIWLSNDIVVIDPDTGNVLVRKNFDFLKNRELSTNLVAQEMNGIAFDNEKNEIILTGKMWGNLYMFEKKIFEK